MSNQSSADMSINELKGYQQTTIGILEKQIDILEQLEKELVKEEQKNADQKEGNLTAKSAKEYQEILNSEVIKLKNFDIVLAVVGTMKAGKSTTINAIVGREILPNRNRPMTALPTLICHNPEKNIPSISIDPTVLNEFLHKLSDNFQYLPDMTTQHQDMQDLVSFIKNGGQFSNYYEGETDIFGFLYQLNDLVRLTKLISDNQEEQDIDVCIAFPFDNYKNFENLPRIEVAFNLPEGFTSEGRFMLLDTAGPNEAGQDELKEALTQQLQRSSAVVIVLDYTQLNSDAEQEVKEEIEKIPSVQKNRLFTLINKFDQKNANADEADATRHHIFNNLLKDKIELDNIFAISAQDSYLANRMKTYIQQHGMLPTFEPKTWVEDFAKKVYGEMADEMYPISNVEMVNKGVEKIIVRSRMQQPMTDMVGNMQKNAPYIAIQSAVAGANQTLHHLNNTLNIRGYFANKKELTQQEIQNLKESIAKLNEQIHQLKKTEQTIQTKVKESLDNATRTVAGLSQHLKDTIDPTVNQIVKQIIEDISSKNNSKKGKSKDYKWYKYYRDYDEAHKIKNIEKNIKYEENNRTVTFSTITGEDVRDKFVERIVIPTNKMIDDDINITCKSVMLNLSSSIKKQMDTFKDDLDIVLKNVQKEFKTSDIDIKMDFKADSNFVFNIKKIEGVNLSYSTKDMVLIENGFLFYKKFARIFRKWKDVGIHEYKDYSISIDYIIEKLNEKIEGITKSLHTQLKTHIEDIKSDVFKDMEKLTKAISGVVNELDNELKNNTERDLEDKQTYYKFVQQAQNDIKDIEEDWEKMLELFGVENNNQTTA